MTNIHKTTLVVLYILVGQWLQGQTLEQQVLTAMSQLDTTEITSGRFYERSLEYVPLGYFDGLSLADSVYSTGTSISYMRGMLEWAKVSGADTNEIDAIFASRHRLSEGVKNYLGFYCQEYHRFKEYAIDSNLITWNGTHFVDVFPRSESPYVHDTVFAFACFTNQSDDLSQNFEFDPNGLWGDLPGAYDSLEINFDDGQGYRSIDEDTTNTWAITYVQYDTFYIRVKFHLTGGQTRLAQSRLVIDPSVANSGTPGGGSGEYSEIPDTCFKIGDNVLDTIWHLDPWTGDTITHVIEGVHKNGVEVCYWYNNSCGEQKVRKPLIVVEGFDPTNSYNFDIMIGGEYDPVKEEGYDALFDQRYGKDEFLRDYVHEEGYDIFYINYANSTIDQEQIAVYVKQAIEQINDLKHVSGSTEKNIVIGASMGGLVGKWALRMFEMNAEDHETELFISFDSPLQGANIPLGMQAMLGHLGDHKVFGMPLRDIEEKLGEGISTLNCQAARNMVYYHYNAVTGNSGTAQEYSAFHDAFYDRFEAIGDLDINHVAISNGTLRLDANGRGIGMSFEPGDLLLGYVGNLVDGALRLLVNLKHHAAVFAIEDGTDFMVLNALIEQKILIAYFQDNSNQFITNARPYDSAPGGMRPFDEVKKGRIDHQFPWAYNAFGFIPTISSLDLDIVDPYFQNIDLTDKELITSTLTTVRSYEGSLVSAERFRIPGFNDFNMEHVTLNRDMTEWFLRIVSEDQSLTSPLETTYNFGQSPEAGHSTSAPFISTGTIIDDDLDIKGSGELWIDRNDRISYIANPDHPDNKKPQEFEVHVIANLCTGDSTTVHAQEQSQIIVGDQSVGNVGQLYIHDDAKVVASDDTRVLAESYSEIHVMDGGKLILEPGGKLETWFEARVYVHDGGTLIVEPGGILQIMHQSSLIVEQGGKLVLKDGAKVRLWDGPNEDGEAHIHIMGLGELDVRGVIDFSGNGYFRFEENNIFTHENEPFALEGMGLNFRFIQLEEDAELHIGEQGLNLGQGKITYFPNSKVVLPNNSKVFCDSMLFAGIFDNANETGLKLIHTQYAIFHDCEFTGLESGIEASNMYHSATSINLRINNSTFTDCNYGLTCIDGTTAQLTNVEFDGLSQSDQAIVYEDWKTSWHNNVSITSYEQGVLLDNEGGGFNMFRETDITNCGIGVWNIASHVFFHNGSLISNNDQGVLVNGHSTGSIVEFSCSGLTHNGVGVTGSRIFLSVDAGGASQAGGIVGPNIFLTTSPNRIFDYIYAIAPAGMVLARGNYWGGGAPTTYKICASSGCGPAPGDVPLISTGFLTEEPTTCTIPQTPNDDCDNLTNHPGGGNVEQGDLFMEAHQTLDQDSFDMDYFDMAGDLFTPIANTSNQDRDAMDSICQNQIDYARVYLGLSAPQNLQMTEESIEDFISYKELESFLRPVPATHNVWVDSDLPVQIEIFNLSGSLQERRVLRRPTIDISEYQAGTYIMRLINVDTDELLVKKFIKH